MRYRRFGRSDLEVSEVGFGVWTLASDWWGRIDDPRGMLHAALDAGINFIDTAPVYGDDGVGETLLADVQTGDDPSGILQRTDVVELYVGLSRFRCRRGHDATGRRG